MRVFLMVACLAVGFRAAADPASPEPPPDCSVFSLEGIALGATLAEAKAATPGFAWKHRKPDENRGDEWEVVKKGAKMRDRIALSVYFSGAGKVRMVERSYIQYSVMTGASEAVPSAALIHAFRERFGRRATETKSGAASREYIVGTTIHWSDDACAAMAWVEEGKAFFGGAEAPVLYGGISDSAAWSAQTDAQAAKVKF